jgi:hypothetical protein
MKLKATILILRKLILGITTVAAKPTNIHQKTAINQFKTTQIKSTTEPFRLSFETACAGGAASSAVTSVMKMPGTRPMRLKY